jgi:hypothetical protein
MPSLTRVPITCPAAQTSSVRRLPSAPQAPNMARAARAGQRASDPAGRNAEATRQPTGSPRRLITFVLAQRSTAPRWSAVRAA